MKSFTPLAFALFCPLLVACTLGANKQEDVGPTKQEEKVFEPLLSSPAITANNKLGYIILGDDDSMIMYCREGASPPFNCDGMDEACGNFDTRKKCNAFGVCTCKVVFSGEVSRPESMTLSEEDVEAISVALDIVPEEVVPAVFVCTGDADSLSCRCTGLGDCAGLGAACVGMPGATLCCCETCSCTKAKGVDVRCPKCPKRE